MHEQNASVKIAANSTTKLTAYFTTRLHNLAALYIRNVSDETVQLDYLDLNLPFSHATLQHHSLEPQGTPGDSTVLYLISERSLKETLYPWTYYQDLKRETQASVADS